MDRGVWRAKEMKECFTNVFTSKNIVSVEVRRTGRGAVPLCKMQSLDRYLGLVRAFRRDGGSLYYHGGEDEVYCMCFAVMLTFFGHPIFRAILEHEMERFKGEELRIYRPMATWEDTHEIGELFFERDLETNAGGLV